MSNLVVSAEGLRNYILEGVDNLRIRKCRPDRETIAHYVLRKYGGSLQDIFNELENIVDEGLLLKVEYKGSTSYRTPESFDQKNSPLLTKHSKILNSSKTTRFILTTINDLLVQTPDYCTLGIPLAELKVKLKEQDALRFADDKVEIAFNREVSIGNVLLGEGGRVYPKDIQPKKQQLVNNNPNNVTANGTTKDANGNDTSPTSSDKAPKKRGRKSNAEKAALAAAAAAITSPTPSTSAVVVKEEKPVEKIKPEASPKTVKIEPKIEDKVAEAVRKTFDGRVSGRNKIKRKVFDPSDVPTPSAAAKAAAAASSKKKRRSLSTNEAADSCEICNKKSDAKNFIVCSSCAVSYHGNCLGMTKDQQAQIVVSEWLCSECRICNACSSPLKTSNHVECVKCKSGFHTVCVGDEADFICGECVFNKTGNKDAKPGVTESTSPLNVKRRGRPPKNTRKLGSTSPGTSSAAGTSSSASSPAKSVTSPGRGRSSRPESVDEATNTVPLEEPPSVVRGEAAIQTDEQDQGRDDRDDATEEPLRLDDRPSDLDGRKCSEWSPQDVEKYFNDKGLPEAGALFREQEVDGLSLLLMKRSDVIFGLRLRLGPALKVYKLILQLQNNIST